MPEIDYDAVKEFWNEKIAGDLVGRNKIRFLTEKRREQIRKKSEIWKSHGMNLWEVLEGVRDEVENSRFLQGETGRDSWTGIDWSMLWERRDRWAEILEGKYRDEDDGDDLPEWRKDIIEEWRQEQGGGSQ